MKQSSLQVLTLTAILLAANCLGQESKQPQARSLEVADVVTLLQSGMGEDVVISKLQKDGKAFDLSAEDLMTLKKAGATNAVLKMMLSPSIGSAIPTTQQPAAAAASGLPDEQGVYAKIKGEWKQIDPEIVNMRTANMLGAAFSYGISKAKIKGDIDGTRSKVQLAGPVEILVRCADGVSASEYNVVKMEEKAGRREFEAAKMGFASAQGGVRKGVVAVKFEKVGKATYTGVLSNVSRGEYGILPPGAATSATTGSAGKIYTFSIIE